MAIRLYISKLEVTTLTDPDGTTFPSGKPSWLLTVPMAKQVSAAIDLRHGFWIGQLNTTSAEHTALLADNKVRYIPQLFMGRRLSALTTDQYNQLAAITNFVGIPLSDFAGTARVRLVLKAITGQACWQPIQLAIDEPDS